MFYTLQMIPRHILSFLWNRFHEPTLYETGNRFPVGMWFPMWYGQLPGMDVNTIDFLDLRASGVVLKKTLIKSTLVRLYFVALLKSGNGSVVGLYNACLLGA